MFAYSLRHRSESRSLHNGSATPLPDGVSGTAYSSTIAATGFPAPTFTLADGDFIWPGLTLDALTGVISGIPAAEGNNFFTITATNDLGSDSRQFELTMNAAPAIDVPSLPDATVGTAYQHGVSATGSPTPTYSVSAGALPDGLSLDPASGVVSGTPTAAGPTTFTITASNTAGSDPKAFSVSVRAALPISVPVLAFTGSDALPWMTAGALTILVGLVLLVLAALRRRRAA